MDVPKLTQGRSASKEEEQGGGSNKRMEKNAE
jgi:hypothetical protein